MEIDRWAPESQEPGLTVDVGGIRVSGVGLVETLNSSGIPHHPLEVLQLEFEETV